MGCALGLPYLMDFNLPILSGKLAKMAPALGEPTWMHSEVGAAKLAVHAVARLIKDVGLPLTLREHGLAEKDLEKMADTMLALYFRAMNPRPMGKKEAVQYFRNMWNGTL